MTAGRDFLLMTIRGTGRHLSRARLEYTAYVLGALLPLLVLIIWALVTA